MSATKRWINFAYTSDYWYTLAGVSEYLEECGFVSGEDFTWKNNGHVLEIDRNAHFDIKECHDWQQLINGYEKVGQLHFIDP